MLIALMMLACALSWFILALVGIQTWLIAAMCFGIGLIAGVELAARYPSAAAIPPVSNEHMYQLDLASNTLTPMPSNSVPSPDGSGW